MINNKNYGSAICAILPAAGVGSRMQAQCPKQYLPIGNKTIIEHTIAALLQHPRITQVIVAISASDDRFVTLPIAQDSRVQVVIGGQQRADSVMAGLMQPIDMEWVLVHDAARPCLHFDDLDRLLAITAHSSIGGILAAPVRDTMKRAQASTQTIEHTVERQGLWHALTPQLFSRELLKKCLQQALSAGVNVTDEAFALEYCGYHPLLVPGRLDNIKVTQPEDLALATFYLTQQKR